MDKPRICDIGTAGQGEPGERLAGVQLRVANLGQAGVSNLGAVGQWQGA